MPYLYTKYSLIFYIYFKARSFTFYISEISKKRFFRFYRKRQICESLENFHLRNSLLMINYFENSNYIAFKNEVTISNEIRIIVFK